MALRIGKKLLGLLMSLLVITFLTYLLLYLSPGDPAEIKLKSSGVIVNEESIEKAREEMGVNDPFLVQYGRWLSNACKGDLGTSYKNEEAVMSKLVRATRYTAKLAVVSLLVAVLIACPLAIVTAVYQNGILDYIIRFLSFVANGLPNFVVSMGLMYFFCLKWKVLPILTDQGIRGMILPVATLVIGLLGKFIRAFRSEIMEQLGQDYVLSARTRGVRENIIRYQNVLYNSLPTMLNIIGLSFGTLLGGTVVVETIFIWPGLGKMAMDAISYRDYPVILGFVIWMTLIFVAVNGLMDIAVMMIDPRVRKNGGEY